MMYQRRANEMLNPESPYFWEELLLQRFNLQECRSQRFECWIAGLLALREFRLLQEKDIGAGIRMRASFVCECLSEGFVEMRKLVSCTGVVQCENPLLRALPASSRSCSRRVRPPVCSMGRSNRTSNIIKVVVNGAGSEVGKAAVAAIHKARGMELAGALDSKFQGQDAGEVAGLDEALEVPILNDLVMVLGSLSQGTSLGVFVDLDDPSAVYENVRQATAFGLKSVVGVPGLGMDQVGALSTFCEKASTGCIVAPSLSIGAVLLQQAAAAAAFQYNRVEIIESQQGLSEYPSQQATQLASSLSGLGQIYNDGDASRDFPARGDVVGDGVRIHSMALPGLVSSLDVRFAGPGETLSFRHDVADMKALMPGLILAIRRVVRLKSLVYGLEKIL